MEVDVGEHEGEAEVRVVVAGVESLQIFVLKEGIYQPVLGQLQKLVPKFTKYIFKEKKVKIGHHETMLVTF